MKRHKKNQKCLAPLVFPMLEREKRHKQGLVFSEISTPRSTDQDYQDKSSSVCGVSQHEELILPKLSIAPDAIPNTTIEGFPKLNDCDDNSKIFVQG